VVETLNLVADRKRTLQVPDVAYFAGTGGTDTLMVSWAEIQGGEHAMVATIPNGSTTAHPPLDVMTGDTTSLVFNAAASGGGRFGLGIVDDNGPDESGISIASLAAGCRTDIPSTCDVKRSLQRVFREDIDTGVNFSASVAPVGSGFVVVTAYGVSGEEPQFLTSVFFNEALALTRTQRLFSAPDGSSLKSVWISNNSMTGLANAKSVLAYQLLKADGTLSLRGLTTTPPQSFEFAFSVTP
jgi:hypothetical protein